MADKFSIAESAALIGVAAGITVIIGYFIPDLRKYNQPRPRSTSWYETYQKEHADYEEDDWDAELNAEALARWDGKWKGIGWTPEEDATLSEEEKEAIAEQIYNDWEAGKITATDVDEYWERYAGESYKAAEDEEWVEVLGYYEIHADQEIWGEVYGLFIYEGVVYEFEAAASLAGPDWELEWDDASAIIPTNSIDSSDFDEELIVPLSMIESAESRESNWAAESFSAPRRKKLDFVWIGEDSSDKEWEKAGEYTIAAATKKAKAEGWKPVWSQYWGDNPATKKSRMRREAKVWNLMSKSPQWKPWLKFLTERNADNEMSETMDIFRGRAHWKDKNRNSVSILGTTQDYGPWIYDEDRIYVPDHFSEDGGWQVLVKGNQALLLYYIADYDGFYTTPLMRKTFNLSPVKATKTTTKAKPKATKKSKAKAGRKAPTISATRRKIGTRMRGNDGKMWQVKKSGKSQRWVAGAETFEAPKTQSLFKKDGMWISDWNKSDSGDDEGCWKRQKEQDSKAKALVAKMKSQGWKRIPNKDGKVNSTIINEGLEAGLLQAIKKYNADVKKKWGNKKVKMSGGKDPAWKYFTFFPWDASVKKAFKEWSEDSYYPFTDYFTGELGGYGALMQKGNQYKLIMTGGSDDDEAGYFSTPVIQLTLKGSATSGKASPKGKAKTTKKKTGRKAPTISATKRKVGTRMRGNDGKMWQVKKSGKSQRWVAGAEDFEWGRGHQRKTPLSNSLMDAKDILEEGGWEVVPELYIDDHVYGGVMETHKLYVISTDKESGI